MTPPTLSPLAVAERIDKTDCGIEQHNPMNTPIHTADRLGLRRTLLTP